MANTTDDWLVPVHEIIDNFSNTSHFVEGRVIGKIHALSVKSPILLSSKTRPIEEGAGLLSGLRPWNIPISLAEWNSMLICTFSHTGMATEKQHCLSPSSFPFRHSNPLTNRRRRHTNEDNTAPTTIGYLLRRVPPPLRLIFDKRNFSQKAKWCHVFEMIFASHRIIISFYRFLEFCRLCWVEASVCLSPERMQQTGNFASWSRNCFYNNYVNAFYTNWW